jgi:hypothetical protein
MNRFGHSNRRLLVIASIVIVILLSAVPIALAFEGYEGEEVIIDDVVEDDVYVSAGRFVLNGTIAGDLIVFANTVEINGIVEGDLLALGQTIIVDGSIGDDARIGGYAIVLDGEVADDIIAASYSMESKEESSVGGDLVCVGFQALLKGQVAEDVIISAPAVEITGDIEGNASVNLGDTAVEDKASPMMFPFAPASAPDIPHVSLGLAIDKDAAIGGDLDYTASSEFDIPSGVVAGDVAFAPYTPGAGTAVHGEGRFPLHWLRNLFVRNVRLFITLLIVGALMMWLLPGWSRRLSETVRTKPLSSLGWGAVASVALTAAVGIVLVAGLVVVILLGFWRGAVVSMLGLSLAAVLLAMTQIVISLTLGQLILKLFKSPATEHRWWPLILGVPVLTAITALFSAPPGLGCCLGTLVWALVACLGLGAIWIWGREQLGNSKAPPEKDVPLLSTEDAPPS